VVPMLTRCGIEWGTQKRKWGSSARSSKVHNAKLSVFSLQNEELVTTTMGKMDTTSAGIETMLN